MDNRTNLDDYLAGLGISDADESELPPPAPDALTGTPTLEAAAEDPRSTLEAFLRGLLGRIDPELQVNVTQADDALEANSRYSL